MSELALMSAAELAEKIREKEISSMEVTDHFIGRIERLDSDVNAVVVKDFDRALSAASQADKQLARGDDIGPLHGVPITVKESLDVAGLATTWGIPQLRDNIAETDAVAVDRLKQAGAIVMGKTNVPYCLADYQSYNELYGVTNNPWDLNRSPGGSSGGSAAALAAGLSPLEVGSDIGGSIRIPAHFCGVYGHKPTWGIVPHQGHTLPGSPAAADLGVVGPMARCADDLRLSMDLLAGADPLNQPGWKINLPRPRKKSLSEYRVAILADDAVSSVDQETVGRAVGIGEMLAKLGATVSDAARPKIDFKQHQDHYIRLLWSHMSAGVTDEEYIEARKLADSLSPEDQSDGAITTRARVLSHRDWLSSNNQREYFRYAWREFFNEWDVLICPVHSTPAFTRDLGPMEQRKLIVNGQAEDYWHPLFWGGISVSSYLPSTVVPTGPSEAGLPIGLQILSAEYNDYLTIDFARLLSEHLDAPQLAPGYE